jgi:hypothetical protein
VPRLINSICDHALSIGFRRQLKRIGADVVMEAAEEMGLIQPSSGSMESNAEPLARLAQTGS